MFDERVDGVEFYEDSFQIDDSSAFSTPSFLIAKRCFDIVTSILLLPVLGLLCLAFTALNPLLNRGPLFFAQERMGRNCKPFTAMKFRTMAPAKQIARSAEQPLEIDRITRLGRIMRKTRMDELPQILDVLRGDMSLIGPRPDYYEHACHFLKSVPGYRARHLVRPGISGLAQTEVGYVEGSEGTKRKVRADLYYIANSGLRLELWVVWRTISVIFGRAGS